MQIWFCAVLALVLAVFGCTKDPEAASPVVRALPGEPDKAQPKLPTMKIWVGAEELTTELALTDKQRIAGMMYRTNMAENEAMLFVFPVPHRSAFWMKNTPLPLSAAYIAPDGTIMEIHDLHPYSTNSAWARSDRIQYVLETNQGWFKKRNIGPGTVVRTERGTLQETFFRR
jgi:uncharacterized protein